MHIVNMIRGMNSLDWAVDAGSMRAGDRMRAIQQQLFDAVPEDDSDAAALALEIGEVFDETPGMSGFAAVFRDLGERIGRRALSPRDLADIRQMRALGVHMRVDACAIRQLDALLGYLARPRVAS